MSYRCTKHTAHDRTGDVAKDVEQREIEDTARGVAEPIDTENAEHITGTAAPVGRKAILHGQNCANTTVKFLQCSVYQTKCRTMIDYTQMRCQTIIVIW